LVFKIFIYFSTAKKSTINMKLLMKSALLIILTIFTLQINAQNKLTKDADIAFLGEKYTLAIDLYKKAFAKEKNKVRKAEILYKIGESYRNILDSKQALNWYQKALKANHPEPKIHLYIAEALKFQGNYEEAIVKYQEYQALSPENQEAAEGIAACETAKKWQEEPMKFEVDVAPLINSKQYDFSPTFGDRKKYNTIYFSSSREGSTGKDLDQRIGQNFSDIYTTKVDKTGKFSTPVPLSGEVNTEANEGSPIVNKRGNEMYFTRCSVIKKDVSGCQIYKAKKSGNNWAKPEKLTFAADTNVCGHPTLTPDEKALIFASDMPGGFGGKDLYIVTYDSKEKKWNTPVNLGAEINTKGDEMFPYVRANGVLYFATNGRTGLGGLDIFSAKSIGQNKWGNPENMKAPINSSYDDYGLIIQDKEDKGFFTSNRPGGKGNDDLWMFAIPKIIYIIQGNVTDIETGKPIENATVKLIGSDGSSAEMKTDNTGFFRFAENGMNRFVNEKTSYSILVSATDYLNGKGKETTIGVEESTTFVKDFALQYIKKNEIRMPEVQYDLGKATLTAAAKDSLEFLYNVLSDNPNITIELSAHTDTRGSDKSNLTLSDARAKSCVDYLISRGIETERMTSKGYGETMPIISDDEIAKMKSVEEKEAAHQKNRRTVFKVLKTDFVSKIAPKVEEPVKKEGEPETDDAEEKQESKPETEGKEESPE
jgi:peptidoglycan-associated lipoprotein